MEDNLKVLFIINRLTRVAPIMVTYNIIKYMLKNDFEPVILTLFSELEDSAVLLFEELNIPIVKLNIKKSGFNFIQIATLLKKYVKKINPEIIHVQLFSATFFTQMFLSNYPLLTTIHCDYDEDFKMCYGKIKGWIISRIYDYLLSKIPYRYACSKQLSILLNNKKNFNISYIDNGIDIKKFYPTTEKNLLRKTLKLPEDKNIFIWSALHLPRKNPFVLTQIISKIKNDNIFFVICGGGPLEEEIKKELKNCTNVKLTGNVKNINEYLRASNYYISTSLSEGLPLSVLEGMASGLPVILSNIPQHKILFEQGYEIGLTFEPQNAEQLFNCIFNILKKDNRVLQNNCIKLISENYTAQIMSKKYQEEYRKILRAKNNA